MKANHGPRSAPTLVAAALALFAASCAERRIAPSPAPTPTARPVPPPAAPVQPGRDWPDAPITPGDWRWAMEGGLSVARFAGGLLVLRCDPASRTVALQREGGPGQGQVPLTLLTSNGNRQLTATAQPNALSVSFAGHDSVLDAIAFSRGRFAVEAAGLPTLYVPSWPEVSRVVEDCR